MICLSNNVYKNKKNLNFSQNQLLSNKSRHRQPCWSFGIFMPRGPDQCLLPKGVSTGGLNDWTERQNHGSTFEAMTIEREHWTERSWEWC